ADLRPLSLHDALPIWTVSATGAWTGCSSRRSAGDMSGLTCVIRRLSRSVGCTRTASACEPPAISSGSEAMLSGAELSAVDVDGVAIGVTSFPQAVKPGLEI